MGNYLYLYQNSVSKFSAGFIPICKYDISVQYSVSGIRGFRTLLLTWNFAVKKLGAVKTSVYIYMVPVITVVTSVLILHEQLTLLEEIGTVLALIGLFLSEHKTERKGAKNGLAE